MTAYRNSTGPVIEGDKVFVDHTYNTSQITQKDDSGVSFSGDSLLFFDMYPGALANEIPSHPWTLNTGNTTDGFVLPGLYSVTVRRCLGHGRSDAKSVSNASST